MKTSYILKHQNFVNHPTFRNIWSIKKDVVIFLGLYSLCFMISVILIFFLVTQKVYFTILMQIIFTFN